jgi:ketosteroid isomerase-like protein
LPHPPETLVSQWIEAFNARNLDRMLACMSADVRFYPLRLAGLERYYRGHDGVRGWFARMKELNHQHRIALHNLRAEPDGEVIAIGELRLENDPDPARFWARDQVEDGQIVVAHHYLTDPDIFGSIAPARRRGRPSRFHGL